MPAHRKPAMTAYEEYLRGKAQFGTRSGFYPLWLPEFLFGFQRALVTWAIEKGRGAVFADCGLGKTPMQLVWCQNVVEKTRKPVLLLTPLAVGPQTVREAHKFGIAAAQSRDGKVSAPITVTNYQQLHKFDWQEFAGIACDESSILKNFDGKTKAEVTEFMRRLPYRSLWTATAAPNDYIELGTSSEALGELGFIDMLKMFFKSNDNTYAHGGSGGGGLKRFNKDPFGGKFRFRGHAARDFWRWVCSWARAVRNPSDLGFPNDGYKLPELQTVEHVVTASRPREDMLFDLPAISLAEQRAERRRTINERCEMAAKLICSHDGAAVAWCHLNEEGHMLEKIIPGAVEVEGNDSDERKEEVLEAFATGEVKRLVTKPSIAGFGQNWQHCAHMTFFPSHSFEQWYQSVRRCWRFGQKNPVRVDVISSEGEAGVTKNLNRKAMNADAMFANLVALINSELRIEQQNQMTKQEEIPAWL